MKHIKIRRGVLSPADAVININLKEMTEQVLNTLTPREERILKMRFGLEDGTEHTLEEVGQTFGITRDRFDGSKQRPSANSVIPPQPPPTHVLCKVMPLGGELLAGLISAGFRRMRFIGYKNVNKIACSNLLFNAAEMR